MSLTEDHTSPYVEFLNIANRAFREADSEQRRQIRACATQHLPAVDYTARIKEIMQW